MKSTGKVIKTLLLIAHCQRPVCVPASMCNIDVTSMERYKYSRVTSHTHKSQTRRCKRQHSNWIRNRIRTRARITILYWIVKFSSRRVSVDRSVNDVMCETVNQWDAWDDRRRLRKFSHLFCLNTIEAGKTTKLVKRLRTMLKFYYHSTFVIRRRPETFLPYRDT